MRKEPTKQQTEPQGNTTSAKPTSLQEALGTGAFAGVAAGFAAHYLAGGKLTFPIFIVAYLFILGGLKGWGKFVGLVAFTAIAALVASILQNPFFQLSEKPELPPATDSLHGAASPAEMNRIVDGLLAVGSSAIGQDSSLASQMRIGVMILCALIVVTAVWIVVRRRRTSCPPTPVWRTVLLILTLTVPVPALTVTTSLMQGRLLQSSGILKALRNENTRPPIVREGTMVEVEIPTTLQSVYGYHECTSLKMNRAVATLPSGEEVPLSLTDAHLSDGGSKPGKSDFITFMENVKLRLQFNVPNDPRLCGTLIDMSATGSLRLIPSGSKEPINRGDFDTTARFRVARNQEADFQASHDAVSSKITGLNWFSFLSAGFAFIAITFFSPWLCRKCHGRVSAFKIRDGHLCPKCSDEQQRDAEAKKKAAEQSVPTSGA
jgi:hypothetical protein